MTLEEILSLPDIGQKISYLKKGRKTELPDRCKLWDDWNPERHEIMVDKDKYPDRKVLEKEAEKVFDEKAGKTYEIEAKYKTEPVNRISIPLEQDIVNIQTAFTGLFDDFCNFFIVTGNVDCFRVSGFDFG